MQYPHYIFISTVPESVKDENGNYLEVVETWTLHTECREETNGKAKVIIQDGKSVVFSSVIHMPLTAKRIPEGSNVLVCESSDATGAIRIKGQVLKFDVGQLHNRLWV